MKEIQEAASLVQEQAHEDANIIFGASIDDTLGENVKVTVIATGFDTQDLDVAVEVPAARASLAPHTMSMSSAPPRSLGSPSSMRPSLEVPAMSSRRPSQSQIARASHETHDARSQAPSSLPRPSARTAPQQDAFPSLDHDWDVPAFQRKQR
jgi:cell division protein FtsZ